MLLCDEFLVIVKYVIGKSVYNVMRMQGNTNFIFNCFNRVHQHDMDLSAYS